LLLSYQGTELLKARIGIRELESAYSCARLQPDLGDFETHGSQLCT
jgi:hypothetical protein